ncbi:MAG TPA: carbamoyltransferase HypF [Syntrophorhabdales bacterium]|nr:carbamoyltransferase HypF [Syntrophorhabdales bacterium]
MDRPSEDHPELKHISVRGVVQGVGFRPFIYRLACEHGLKGWVINTSSAVEIEVEGAEGEIEAFLRRVPLEAPPRARIEGIETASKEAVGYAAFEIRESRSDAGYQLISPDIATCSDCIRELFDSHNRRYRYPFTNCTNCGPRFTIITDIPYDRPHTTMAPFRMCELCLREYEDPLDRRFHAQPNACPNCGPGVWLEDSRGVVRLCEDAILETAGLLRQGAIAAIKGLGGFQLACDATNTDVVATLRERKRRPHKPFALMMRDSEEVRSHCFVDDGELRLLSAPEAPIVLLRARDGSPVSPLVAPGNRYSGVMLPYTPIHHLLMHDFGGPLVMTSGNVSEEPIAKDNEDAKERLGKLADYFLFHNRDIYSRYDDSVLRVRSSKPEPIRRARSYAPYPVKLPFSTRPILATGAEEKNTFCLTRDEFAFLSQHIGDMENLETLDLFVETIDLYKRLFRIVPEACAHDLHPDYLSTRHARQLEGKLPLVGVQHHHAHVASCMAEHALSGPVIGIAFDGSGFGLDNTVWGGEFFVATYGDFERVAHLERMPLPGGEVSIRRPYRLAYGYLSALGMEMPRLPFLVGIPEEEQALIAAQVAQGINTPLTSSCGRLFDAAAALLNLCGTITFEGQAAIALEMAASRGPTDPYPFSMRQEDGRRVIEVGELMEALVSDAGGRKDVSEIAARFHHTVARMIGDVAALISRETGIRDVVLSGGCFQNRLLCDLAAAFLAEAGLRSLFHRHVPCNDGGISLGQAAVASARLRLL